MLRVMGMRRIVSRVGIGMGAVAGILFCFVCMVRRWELFLRGLCQLCCYMGSVLIDMIIFGFYQVPIIEYLPVCHFSLHIAF